MIPVIIAAFILLSTSTVKAEPADDAWEAYLAGDFDLVAEIVSVAIADPTISNKERARLYLAIGCSDAMRGRDASASAAFEQTLTLNPSLKLTAGDLPPPVWKLFQPVHDRLVERRAVDLIPADTLIRSIIPVPPDTVRQLVPFTRPIKTVLKSIAFPGWGHLSERRRRGLIFSGVEAIAIIGWVWATVNADQAREDYLRVVERDKMESSYDKYNRYYQLSWGLGITALATYIAAQVDFFAKPPPLSLSIQNQPNMQQNIAVTLTIRL